MGKKKANAQLCQSIDKLCADLDEYLQLYLYLPLIAIAPSFHKHNFIDQKHHQLLFKFLIFEILESINHLNFILKTIEGNLFSKIQIPAPQEKITPPHKLHPM